MLFELEVVFSDTFTNMMDLLSNQDPNFVFWLMLLHCIIGLLAAIVAEQKGRSFLLWLFIGLIGGTFGLISALFLPAKSYQ
jgi:uncharacterized membrane protein